ncbi:MAG: hypothetical protein WAT74_02965 [Flavobacteriales bacterium]
MNALELRSEIIALLNKTDDISMLEWLKNMLSAPSLTKEQIDDMQRTAALSEEDIAAGRTYTVDEVERWLDEQKRKA